MKNFDQEEIFNKIEIIFEDDNFLIINKPANLIVHPAKIANGQWLRVKQKTLADWLLKYRPEIKAIGDQPEIRPGIVHRLDKEVSGLILVAKNQKSFEYFKREFQNHRIKKEYLALVFGQPKKEKEIITFPLTRGKKGKIVLAKKVSLEKIKETWTEYEILKKFDKFSLLRIKTKTGRTHQIRIHLKSIGHPIVGDKQYSIKKTDHFLETEQLGGRIFLHASQLGFYDPDRRWFEFKIDLPEELKNFLKTLN